MARLCDVSPSAEGEACDTQCSCSRATSPLGLHSLALGPQRARPAPLSSAPRSASILQGTRLSGSRLERRRSGHRRGDTHASPTTFSSTAGTANRWKCRLLYTAHDLTHRLTAPGRHAAAGPNHGCPGSQLEPLILKVLPRSPASLASTQQAPNPGGPPCCRRILGFVRASRSSAGTTQQTAAAAHRADLAGGVAPGTCVSPCSRIRVSWLEGSNSTASGSHPR